MPVSRSPFTDAYTRLTEAFPGLEITEESTEQTTAAPQQTEQATAASQETGTARATGTAQGTRRVTTAALTHDPTTLDAFLAHDAAQILRDYGHAARPDVVAGFALHRYAWPACLLITVPWFLGRRVPRYPVTHVSYDRTVPGLSLGRMTVRPTGFACLPGDPAGTLPGAHVVPDEEALRAEVRAAVAEHLEPVLAAFGPRMRRRGRALWGMATDEIVEGLWYVAHLFGEERRAMRELELLLPGATKPYAGAAGFRELTGPNGESLPTRDRASCCMFYTVRPEDTCVTCPRTCDTDRVTKLLTATAA